MDKNLDDFEHSGVLKKKGDDFVMAYFARYPEDMLISTGVRANGNNSVCQTSHIAFIEKIEQSEN